MICGSAVACVCVCEYESQSDFQQKKHNAHVRMPSTVVNKSHEISNNNIIIATIIQHIH